MFTAGQAITIWVGSITLLVLVSGLLGHVGVAGVLVAQVVCIGGVPVAAAVALRPGTVAATLGLRWPRGRTLVGATCVGASFWYLVLWLVVPLSSRYLDGGDELTHLDQLVSQAPLWLVLLAMVTAPAVCEELLLRGVVARSLRPSLGWVGAVLVSAALFALMHFSVARLVPMLCFGLVLASVVFVTHSTIPGMIIHALNNGIALLLARGHLPELAGAIETYPSEIGVGAIIVFVSGILLIYSRYVLHSMTKTSW